MTDAGTLIVGIASIATIVVVLTDIMCRYIKDRKRDGTIKPDRGSPSPAPPPPPPPLSMEWEIPSSESPSDEPSITINTIPWGRASQGYAQQRCYVQALYRILRR